LPDLTTLSHELDRKKRTCRAIIETPKGSRNKFAYDPETGLFELRGLLPEGMAFPFDFGFVPSTLADDGDPVDILVLMDAPAHVGCLLDVRLVGAIAAQQTDRGKKEENDRLLGVSIHTYQHEDIESIADVSATLLSQIEEFFISYNRQRGKVFKVTATSGPKRAVKVLEAGIRTYDREHSSSSKDRG
jgi:inorganic pyrophosphatase